MTWTSRACAIGGILMAVADLRQAPGQAPVFRATTQVVTVQASVLQGKTPVEGLSPADFVLLDNGVRQRVEVMAVEATPLDVTLVFDENEFSVAMIGRRFEQNLLKIDLNAPTTSAASCTPPPVASAARATASRL
jgi:hypothetical protein